MMTCPTCGKAFVCNKPLEHPVAHECFTCNYATQMEQARERFAPLGDALKARLPWAEPSVEQTGGMVMCLAVPLDGELEGGRYVMFAEHGSMDEKAGFGYYDDSQYPDGYDEEGRYWFSNVEDTVENVDAIAAWAAPIIERLRERDPAVTGTAG